MESSLLTEEVNRKNLDNTRSSGNALTVRGRSSDRGKSSERAKSHSKSRGRNNKDVECYHCHKKEHMKKNYHI